MKPLIFIFSVFFLISMCSCAGSLSDKDIQKNINDLFVKDMAGAALNATVNDGVATITGQCKGGGCTREVIEKVKRVSGVKKVQTNIIEQP